MTTNWDLRFMQLADYISHWSKDRSTKVGAVIIDDKEVVSMGYNGFPRGSNDDDDMRHERPEKYEWVLHAEENAIINAARKGIKTMNTTMYLNWFPCSKCAGMIVNAGIKKIVCDNEPDFTNKQFGEGFKRSFQKLNEGGVEIVFLNYKTSRT